MKEGDTLYKGNGASNGFETPKRSVSPRSTRSSIDSGNLGAGIDDLQEALSALRKEYDELQFENRSLRARIQSQQEILEDRLPETEDELRNSAKKVLDTDKANSKLRQKIRGLSQENEDLREQSRLQEREIISLKSKLEMLTKEIKGLEEEIASSEEETLEEEVLRRTVSQIDREHKKIETNFEQNLQSLLEQLSSEQERLKKLSQENNRLEEELAKKDLEMKDKVDERDAKISSLQKKVDELNSAEEKEAGMNLGSLAEELELAQSSEEDEDVVVNTSKHDLEVERLNNTIRQLELEKKEALLSSAELEKAKQELIEAEALSRETVEQTKRTLALLEVSNTELKREMSENEVRMRKEHAEALAEKDKKIAELQLQLDNANQPDVDPVVFESQQESQPGLRASVCALKAAIEKKTRDRGWNLFFGLSRHKIEIRVDGKSKRFSVPKRVKALYNSLTDILTAAGTDICETLSHEIGAIDSVPSRIVTKQSTTVFLRALKGENLEQGQGLVSSSTEMQSVNQGEALQGQINNALDQLTA